MPPTLPDGDPRNGVEFDFELDFDVPTLDPVDVKGMFAGRIEVGGQKFYVPLYPCVTHFPAIPSIEIPVDSSPQFLIPQIVDHINAGASEVEKGTRKMAMGTSWPRREWR